MDLRAASFAALALAGALALVACGACAGENAPPPAPPLPAELDGLDARLVAAIRGHAARVAQAPGDAARWRELAALYHGNALVEEAERCYEVALELDDRDAETWYAYALTAASAGDAGLARARAERSLELDASYAPAYWRIGQWYFAEGDLDAARSWYERCTAADPSLASGWVGLARVHLQRGEAEPAAAILNERVIGGPNDGYGRALLANAYNLLGRVEEARRLAAEGRGAEPAFPDPRMTAILARRTGRSIDLERANALVRDGKAAEAAALLETLRRAAPEDAVVLSNLGFALLSAGDAGAALQRSREAAALDPSAYRPLLVQAMALEVQGGSRGSPDALALALEAVERLPTAVEALSFLGLLQSRLGNSEGALDAYLRGAAQAPDDAELLRKVGLLQRELKRYDDAERTYAALAALEPTSPAARIELAAIKKERGDLAGAEDELRRALDEQLEHLGERHPDTRTVLLRLAEVLDERGKPDEAEQVRRRIR